MATTHTVNIYDDGFEDLPDAIKVGDSVKWVNNGSNTHTATRTDSPFPFNTGNIASGAESNPIVFTQASEQSGFAYYCHHHREMQSAIYVKAGTKRFVAPMTVTFRASDSTYPDFFRGPVVAITPQEMELWPRDVWRSMRQICAAGACYDLTQDFVHSLDVLSGADRTTVEQEWQRLHQWWAAALGWAAPLHNLDVLGAQPWETLEQLFRRLRRSWKLLNRRTPPLIVKYPRPLNLAIIRSQSHDPFGRAITVLPGKVPNYVFNAFLREITYARASTAVEEALDSGTAISNAERNRYTDSRAAVTASDFLVLALRQIHGLTELFGGTFSIDKFREGHWRMTRAGEWDGPPFSAYHWVQYIEGYLGSVGTGYSPHMVYPLGNWELKPQAKNPVALSVSRHQGILRLQRTEGATRKIGVGLLAGDQVLASWAAPDLDHGMGVLLFSRAADDNGTTERLNGIWGYSPFDGEGSLDGFPASQMTDDFEGTYRGNFVAADGITMDSGLFTLAKQDTRYLFSWRGDSELHGVGIPVSKVFGAGDAGEWLAVAFTEVTSRDRDQGTKYPVSLAAFEYLLDILKGTICSSDLNGTTDETLEKMAEPIH
jgi:plastocyanin